MLKSVGWTAVFILAFATPVLVFGHTGNAFDVASSLCMGLVAELFALCAKYCPKNKK